MPVEDLSQSKEYIDTHWSGAAFQAEKQRSYSQHQLKVLYSPNKPDSVYIGSGKVEAGGMITWVQITHAELIELLQTALKEKETKNENLSY